MKFIISGGTGFIGRRIVTRLLADTHYVAVWSRRPGNEKRTGVASHSWDPLTGEPPSESLNGMDTVIHLAGESVAQRWNADVRKRIRDSRIMGTRRLVDAIGRVQHPPKALVCASAIRVTTATRGTEIFAGERRAWQRFSRRTVPGLGRGGKTRRAVRPAGGEPSSRSGVGK